MSLNHVQIIGNLGKDVKSGVGKGGSLWAQLSVATSKKYKEEFVTTWHRVVAFGRTAESLAQCKKGETLCIVGELQNNEYEKDGQKIQQVQIVARQAYLVEKFKKVEEIADDQTKDFGGMSDDEIPF